MYFISKNAEASSIYRRFLFSGKSIVSGTCPTAIQQAHKRGDLEGGGGCPVFLTQAAVAPSAKAARRAMYVCSTTAVMYWERRSCRFISTSAPTGKCWPTNNRHQKRRRNKTARPERRRGAGGLQRVAGHHGHLRPHPGDTRGGISRAKSGAPAALP